MSAPLPDPAPPSATSNRPALAVLAAGVIATCVAARLAPLATGSALVQSWPPFVLVAGLLLVGVVADDDGLFSAAGARLARLPGGGAPLFAGLMGLVAIVTIVLNLDTAVAFLTPVLIHAARERRLDERPFLYGAVFMSNAASLLLPGSNLTNLLVLARDPMPGAQFGAQMLAPSIASIAITIGVVGLWYRRELRGSETVVGGALPELRVGWGLAATSFAAAALLGMKQPALPVLAVGLAATIAKLARGRVGAKRFWAALDLPTLFGLFGAAVALGALARSWEGPAVALRAVGDTWRLSAIAAIATVLMNNLPAAVLLSSWAPGSRRALLIGLNLGPNLAVTGALSALLWMRIAKATGARPSALTYSKIGVVLVPLTIAGALAACALFAGGGL